MGVRETIEDSFVEDGDIFVLAALQEFGEIIPVELCLGCMPAAETSMRWAREKLNCYDLIDKPLGVRQRLRLTTDQVYQLALSSATDCERIEGTKHVSPLLLEGQHETSLPTPRIDPSMPLVLEHRQNNAESLQTSSPTLPPATGTRTSGATLGTQAQSGVNSSERLVTPS